MSRHDRTGLLAVLVLGAARVDGRRRASATRAPDSRTTTAAVLWQPSMNVFRRFEVPAERMYEFYGGVLGFKQLSTLNVGNGGGVARFQAGAQELKLTRRVADRSYESGGVRAATGLRLLTFFFADEAELSARFVQHGLARARVHGLSPRGQRAALVTDPDGQHVELVIVPGATAGAAREHRDRAHGRRCRARSRLLPRFRRARGAAAERRRAVRHAEVLVSPRRDDDQLCGASASDLPADTGSGGIQYVVSDVELVDALAKERQITIDQPLEGLRGFDLRTIWLDDPDGVTNYFAETGASRRARATTDER